MAGLEDSKLSLRTVVAICTAIVSLIGGLGSIGVWRASSTLTEILRDIHDLKANSLTREEASNLAMRAAIENPGLHIPDPNRPGSSFYVGRTENP